MPSPLPTALGVFSLAGMALIWRDISSKIKGENRTFSSLLSQYLAVKAVGWLGKRQRRKLEADTLNVKQVQEETLLRRLRKNANTCYGRQYDFSSIKGKRTIRWFEWTTSCCSVVVQTPAGVVTSVSCPLSCCDVTVRRTEGRTN